MLLMFFRLNKAGFVTFRIFCHQHFLVSRARNSQNASDFANLRVRKIFTRKRLFAGIIHVSET